MNYIEKDPWRNLKEFTSARIGLGRTGISLPTRELLSFQLAHASAKDALNHEIQVNEYISNLSANLSVDVVCLESQAKDLDTYLKRPDLGRLLSEQSVDKLKNISGKKYFIAITNGLSSLAIERHSLPFLKIFLSRLLESQKTIQKDEIAFLYVNRGRVGITDDIGSCLESKLGIIIVGERPGLSSPDSLGVYLTYQPRSGGTDESRNCISNIRPNGLNFNRATHRLVYLVQESLVRKISGVNLKDRSIEESVSMNIPNRSNLPNRISKPKVKLCGIRDPEIATFSVAESADFLGINLSPASKRKVTDEQAFILAEAIKKANDHYSMDTKIVLLFFKNDPQSALNIAKKIQPDFVQLIHNDPIMQNSWEEFRQNFTLMPAISAMKNMEDSTLPIGDNEIPIIDTPSSGTGGGTGFSFPWERIHGLKRKYLLAGGLNPGNVERAVQELSPWGLDVASGIEDSNGNQSIDKIREFIQNAKR